MRANSWLKTVAILSTFAFCALPSLTLAQTDNSQSSGDPVADAARRSREAKQNAAKPRKVYTDDDLSRPKPAPSAATTNAAPGSQPANTPANATPAATTSSADEDAKAEASWRSRFKDQRDKIARAEKELDILQRETQKAQIQYYPDPQKAMNEQYTRKDINDKEAKIEAKRQEIAALKQGLTDLEDSLRKAGGDPGWAR
jgi:hypothetical protein